jgi:flagellar hook-associated protein 3 FlgL
MRVDPNYVSGLVDSLNKSTLSEQRLTAELSSGLRVSSLSDDPVAAGQASLLATAISQDDRFVQTAATSQSFMQVADSALGAVERSSPQRCRWRLGVTAARRAPKIYCPCCNS